MFFDPSEAEAGQEVRVIVSVIEEVSGIRSISGVIDNPSRSGFLSFGAGKDLGNGDFQGSITIPPTAEEGIWRVRQLTLEDKARNRRVTPYGTESPAVLNVRNPGGDSEPPELLDVYVEQPNTEPGAKNRLIIRARDEKSNIASVSGAYANRAKTALLNFGAKGEGKEGAWIAELTIPANADCGEWYLTTLMLRDAAGNRRIYNETEPSFQRATVFVSFGSVCDNEAPELRSFVFDPVSVDNSEDHMIRITASFYDQSGVAAAYGRINGPPNAEGKDPSIAYSLREENGLWVGTFQVPRHAATGLWRVDFLQVEDKAKNRKVYRRDDPALGAAVIDVR